MRKLGNFAFWKVIMKTYFILITILFASTSLAITAKEAAKKSAKHLAKQSENDCVRCRKTLETNLIVAIADGEYLAYAYLCKRSSIQRLIPIYNRLGCRTSTWDDGHTLFIDWGKE